MKPELLVLGSEGVNTYSPRVSADTFFLTRADNVQPFQGHLRGVRAHKKLIGLNGDENIVQLASAYALSADSLFFYAFTNTNVYGLTVSAGAFDLTALNASSFTFETEEPPSWVQWGDGQPNVVYFTRSCLPLQKLNELTHSEVAATFDPGAGAVKIKARYTAVVDNRLVVAHVGYGTSTGPNEHPRRVQWSNVYQPEDFEIRTGSEADFFDLESDDLEITGLFNYQGALVIFTKNSIWRANYIGYPGVFRFEPLMSGIGNVHHGAAKKVKNQIFFISDDNFYVFENFTVRQVGDPVWPYWKNTNMLSASDQVLCYVEPKESLVWWVYRHKGHLKDAYGSLRFTNKQNTVRTFTMPFLDFVEGLPCWGFLGSRAYGQASAFESFEPGGHLYYRDTHWSIGLRRGPFSMVDSAEREPFIFDLFKNKSFDEDHPILLEAVGSGWGPLSDPHMWAVCYNYKENRWASFDPAGMLSYYSNFTSFSSFQIIDSFNAQWTGDGEYSAPVGIDDAPWDTKQIDGDWQFFAFPSDDLVGAADGIYVRGKGGANNGTFDLTTVLETSEVFFDSTQKVKSIKSVKLSYSARGSSSDLKATIQLGYRKNQQEPIRYTEEKEAFDISGTLEKVFLFDFDPKGHFVSLKIKFYNNEKVFLSEFIGASVILDLAKSASS